MTHPVIPEGAWRPQAGLDALLRTTRMMGDDLSPGEDGEDEHATANLLQKLMNLGALTAGLPVENGGFGLCDSRDGALPLRDLLRHIGRISLSLGRCLEGHVNVIRLVALYGSPDQRAELARSVRRGMLAGIWVTDGDPPVHVTPAGDGFALSGVKGFASGVRLAGLALMTARLPSDETVMVLVPVGDPARIRRGPGILTGMMASGTGAYDVTGVSIGPGAIVGRPGDYLRQPEFSAGAWRGAAVALGGLDRLIDLMRTELLARERDGNPHQQVRFGQALIARETAALWTRQAALAAYDTTSDPGDVSGVVNLARLAVERAGLDVMELVQRGLGLSTFIRGRPVERVMRDLATYLRQPAPDESLTEAAAWFMQHEWPEGAA
ncbi:acyl-CoA dehydrogenase family protein [Neoasaia chiangmaiensis]|uniref:Acyl-CoA dehydrogenase n=1 Tax=Neoasaia chiangmaiensis TaxID=320497 RepID=A0A1U9KSC1_9PROT|nr:acyl-CoA dehydrogenase [Neoasaia chiangmaiensis]AQS88550.1 acyl-CoA dehydrogenase [Neoasaia chiangmaiensis]